MTSTVFKNFTSPAIPADWLNDLNRLNYTVFGNPTNAQTARTNLGLGTAATVNTGTGAANVPTTAEADARYAPIAGNSTQTFAVANATAADEAVALGQFGNSQAQNGYTKLPNGLILQWARIAAANTTTGGAGTTTTFTWPIAFPGGILTAVASPNAAFGGTSTGLDSWWITAASTSGGAIRAVDYSQNGDNTMDIWAIGY